ncbi:hypothetical protein QE152_g32589 [Popillia japonica]|uniref:Uncharacterized protein n=1 Tax=Popillia japonica TaxID=7064 RepID=A0AAW1IYM2_POPJA
MSNKGLQERLLREAGLDLNKAISYCRAMEVSKNQRCGLNHVRGQYPAYNKSCAQCQLKSHFARVCKKKMQPKKVHEVKRNSESEGHNGIEKSKARARQVCTLLAEDKSGNRDSREGRPVKKSKTNPVNNQWNPGKVIEQANKPRSYNVLDDHTIQRNRKDLNLSLKTNRQLKTRKVLNV